MAQKFWRMKRRSEAGGRISAYGINGRSFGKIIYFGKTVPEHEIFAGESAVTMVVCDKEDKSSCFSGSSFYGRKLSGRLRNNRIVEEKEQNL